MSDEEEYFDAYGPPDEGYGEEETPVLPEGHWGLDQEMLTFADQFMTALRNEPQLIEQWYADFAKEHGFRGLAEAIEEKGFNNVFDPGLRTQAIESLKDLNARRKAG